MLNVEGVEEQSSNLYWYTVTAIFDNCYEDIRAMWTG
jgi:hypothetical protein